MGLTHGTAAGNIVEVNGPYAEYGIPEYSEDQGVLMVKLPGRLLFSAGNDELTLKSR